MRGLPDIVGPYIVGGIVLLSLSVVLLNDRAETMDTGRNERAQTIVADLGMQLERDLNLIGHGVPGSTKITRLTSTSLSFLADIDDNGIVDSIEYFMSRSRDCAHLTRRHISPGQRPLTWSMRGAVVRFAGSDSIGNPVSNLELVRGVTMQITTIDPANDAADEVSRTRARRYGGDVNVFWSKTINPPSLQGRAAS